MDLAEVVESLRHGVDGLIDIPIFNLEDLLGLSVVECDVLTPERDHTFDLLAEETEEFHGTVGEFASLDFILRVMPGQRFGNLSEPDGA